MKFEIKLIEEVSSRTLRVAIIGFLVGGSQLSSEETVKIFSQIKTTALSKKVVFDISKLDFWDSEGMREVITIAMATNASYPGRVSIVGPKNGKNFERAKEKYLLGGELIPWEES